MTRRPRWFLPRPPDVLGLLRAQATITCDGLDTFARWSSTGDPAEADTVRDREHQADTARRALLMALREALSTPIDAEDVYVLSERLDQLANGAKDAVQKSVELGAEVDEHTAQMGEWLAEAAHHLADAFDCVPDDAKAAGDAADAAIKACRRIEHHERHAIAGLLQLTTINEVVPRFVLYQAYVNMAKSAVGVADRTWYVVLRYP